MIPASFRKPRVLGWLNTGAVGFALASIVAAAFGSLLEPSPAVAVVIGLPTLFFGALWARVLRSERTVGSAEIRVGWVAAVPLAIANAIVTCLFALREIDHRLTLDDAIRASAFAATIGAVAWLPALLVTLLLFGIPIHRAQRLARKGLAGEERGEWTVGLVCLALSVCGALWWMALPSNMTFRFSGWNALGPSIEYALSAIGALAGGAAAVLAFLRERRRREFVAAVETGTVVGYRIDATDEGKVLLRLSSEGKGQYRVARFEEELFDLAEDGQALRPKAIAVTCPSSPPADPEE